MRLGILGSVPASLANVTSPVLFRFDDFYQDKSPVVRKNWMLQVLKDDGTVVFQSSDPNIRYSHNLLNSIQIHLNPGLYRYRFREMVTYVTANPPALTTQETTWKPNDRGVDFKVYVPVSVPPDEGGDEQEENNDGQDANTETVQIAGMPWYLAVGLGIGLLSLTSGNKQV